jgi:CDP-diacylglycerol--glycerol-3-phosphate 3-phosphatidyltransferase
MLTVLGFIVSVGAAVAIASGRVLLGGALVLFSGAFDLLDGALARAKGQSTPLGALLDSTLDRLSEAAIFIGLLGLYARQPVNVEILLIFIALAGSLLISYVRARAESLGFKGEAGLFTRAERIIVLALGLMLNQVLIALWIIAVLTPVTIVQRLVYVGQQMKRTKESSGRGEECQ